MYHINRRVQHDQVLLSIPPVPSVHISSPNRLTPTSELNHPGLAAHRLPHPLPISRPSRSAFVVSGFFPFQIATATDSSRCPCNLNSHPACGLPRYDGRFPGRVSGRHLATTLFPVGLLRGVSESTQAPQVRYAARYIPMDRPHHWALCLRLSNNFPPFPVPLSSQPAQMPLMPLTRVKPAD